AEVDVAVRHVLRVKLALGLFEHPYVDEGAAAKAFYHPESIALAQTGPGRSGPLCCSRMPMGRMEKRCCRWVRELRALPSSGRWPMILPIRAERRRERDHAFLYQRRWCSDLAKATFPASRVWAFWTAPTRRLQSPWRALKKPMSSF